MAKRKTLADELREREERKDTARTKLSANGDGAHDAQHSESEPWESPIPLDHLRDLPDFLDGILPSWLDRWVQAESVAKQTPVGKTAYPEDIAEMICWFIDGPGLITGEILPIDYGTKFGMLKS